MTKLQLLCVIVVVSLVQRIHAFSSPRFSSRTISSIGSKYSTPSCSFVLRAGESDNGVGNEPIDTPNTPAIEDTMLTIEEDILKDDLTKKKDDPLGVVRLGGTAVMSVVGLAILVNDASKFTPVLGSFLTLALDLAFALAMVAAFAKEWEASKANED